MAGKRPKGNPERVGRLLAGVAVSPALGARLKDLAIWQLWDKAVGGAIAGRAQPLRMTGGVLTVQVSNGPWMQQLSFMKLELRDRINTLLGEERIKEIVLKSGRIKPEVEQPEEAQLPLRQLSEQQQEWIRQQLTDVHDPELHQTLHDLMELHFRRSLS